LYYDGNAVGANRYPPKATTIHMDKQRFDLLYAQIDWEIQKKKPFVVADPVDPEGILHLTEKDYLLTMRSVLRNGDTLTVLARPGSKPNKSDSK